MLPTSRRRLLHLAAAGAALAPWPRRAAALAYPTRPVRIIVGAVPGSAPDVVARLMADWLSQRLDQTFFVDNRNGASGNLASEMVAGAAPDGYTLLLVSASAAINATFYCNLKFNILRDFTPVAGVVAFPMDHHGERAVSGQNPSRVDRRGQAESRQDQYRHAADRLAATRRR
jgi:tripartite-type tricarboxylate transporter receptor subunit TctC